MSSLNSSAFPDTIAAVVEQPPSSKRCKLDVPAVNVPEYTNNDDIDTAAHTELSVDASGVDATGEPLSKRARKKIAKFADYQVKKLARRLKEREKCRQRRAEAVSRGEPPSGPSRKALKNNTMAASTNRTRIAVDLDFEGLMIDKDLCKCAKQLLWVYTINRKASAPAQLYYTGLQVGSGVQQALAKNDGYRNWDINIRSESYEAAFARDQIVYLTSDSDTVLSELSADDVYVIGGLVDHNHHKGLTLARATERGLRTARLPLGEHVHLKTRTVLTIVHVFDILMRVSEGQSWPDAILGVLPSRKGAVAKTNDNDDDTVVSGVVPPIDSTAVSNIGDDSIALAETNLDDHDDDVEKTSDENEFLSNARDSETLLADETGEL